MITRSAANFQISRHFADYSHTLKKGVDEADGQKSAISLGLPLTVGTQPITTEKLSEGQQQLQQINRTFWTLNIQKLAAATVTSSSSTTEKNSGSTPPYSPAANLNQMDGYVERIRLSV
ncbi:MAG: hypothetical protein HQL48_02845, partial [Gammaproteobacteria bacterium]|nr:hypothetical protein [Gammaproteobacteria bacterium]